MTLGESYGASHRKTASQSNFYYSFFFLPSAKREAIQTIYSFFRHLDDIADGAGPLEEKLTRLRACRAALEECYSQEATASASSALRKVVSQFKISQEYFTHLIDGVEMDFWNKRYATFEELYQYCFRVASCVGLICIQIFGCKNQGARDYAVDLGIALQLTNILRDLREDAGRGRIYLPREDLERFRYPEEELILSRYNDSFVELMRFQCLRARDYYTRAEKSLPPEDRPCLVTAEIIRNTYLRILERIEAAEYDVFNRPIRLSRGEKIFIALKTWAGNRLLG